MLSLQSFLRQGVSLSYVGRNYNLKDLNLKPEQGLTLLVVITFAVVSIRKWQKIPSMPTQGRMDIKDVLVGFPDQTPRMLYRGSSKLRTRTAPRVVLCS